MKAVVKKRWITILGPESMQSPELGESYVAEPQQIVGRTIKVNLMNLTADPKKRKYNVDFMVSNWDGSHARTVPYAYETLPSSLKTLVRKGRDRVDHRFILVLGDGSRVVVKPLMITKANTSHSIHTALRKACEDYMKKQAPQSDSMSLFLDVINMKLQREAKKSLDKIFPLNTLELKVVKILQRGRIEKAEPKKKAKKEAGEAEEKPKKKVKKVKEKAETPEAQ